jgi:hypothetical protein
MKTPEHGWLHFLYYHFESLSDYELVKSHPSRCLLTVILVAEFTTRENHTLDGTSRILGRI